MSKVTIACMVFLCVGVGIFLFFSRTSNQGTPLYLPTASEVASVPASATTTPEPDVSQHYTPPDFTRGAPDGYKEYHSTRFHFSLLYPQDLVMTENISTHGALTVTFENTDKNDVKGFQVYVQSYNLPQITEERFKKDIPSGVRKNNQAVTIAGVEGAAFYSFDPNLGETREVWFINKGLLYEASTPKPLESWFRDIFQTWEFIN